MSDNDYYDDFDDDFNDDKDDKSSNSPKGNDKDDEDDKDDDKPEDKPGDKLKNESKDEIIQEPIEGGGGGGGGADDTDLAKFLRGGVDFEHFIWGGVNIFPKSNDNDEGGGGEPQLQEVQVCEFQVDASHEQTHEQPQEQTQDKGQDQPDSVESGGKSGSGADSKGVSSGNDSGSSDSKNDSSNDSPSKSSNDSSPIDNKDNKNNDLFNPSDKHKSDNKNNPLNFGDNYKKSDNQDNSPLSLKDKNKNDNNNDENNPLGSENKEKENGINTLGLGDKDNEKEKDIKPIDLGDEDVKLQPKEYPRTEDMKHEDLENYVRFLNDKDKWEKDHPREQPSDAKDANKERPESENSSDDLTEIQPDDKDFEKPEKNVDSNHPIDNIDDLEKPSKDNEKNKESDKGKDNEKSRDKDKERGKDKDKAKSDPFVFDKDLKDAVDKIDNLADKGLNKDSKDAIKNEVQKIKNKFDKSKEKASKESLKTVREKPREKSPKDNIHNERPETATKSDNQQLLLEPKQSDKSKDKEKGKSEKQARNEKQPKERPRTVIDARDLISIGSSKSDQVKVPRSYGKERQHQIRDRAKDQQKTKDSKDQKKTKESKQDVKPLKIDVKDIKDLSWHRDDREKVPRSYFREKEKQQQARGQAKDQHKIKTPKQEIKVKDISKIDIYKDDCYKVPRPLTKEERARDNFRKFKEQHRKDFRQFDRDLQKHLDNIHKILDDNRIKNKLGKLQKETKDIRKLFAHDGKRINKASEKIRNENDRRKKEREENIKKSLGERKPQKFNKLNLLNNEGVQKAVEFGNQQLLLEPKFYEYTHALKEGEIRKDIRDKKAEEKKVKEKEKEAQKETKEQKEKKDLDKLKRISAEEPRKEAEKIKRELEKADNVNEERLRDAFEKETGKHAVWQKKETKQYGEYKRQFLKERAKKREQMKERWLQEADKSEYWIENQYNADGEIIYFANVYFPEEHEKILGETEENHAHRHEHEHNSEKWGYSWNDYLMSYYGLKSPTNDKKKDAKNKSAEKRFSDLSLSFSEKRALSNTLRKFELGNQLYYRTRELAEDIKNGEVSSNTEALEKKREEFNALYKRLMALNERYSSRFKLLHNLGLLREDKGPNKYEVLPKLLREKTRQDKNIRKIERSMLNDLILRELLLNPSKYRQEPLERVFRKETGKRTVHAGKETKAFQAWKKSLKEELIEKRGEINSEEGREPESVWTKTLKYFMDKMPEKELSKELKSELRPILDVYSVLFAHLGNKRLSSHEKNRLVSDELKRLRPEYYPLFEDLKAFFDTYLLRKLNSSIVSASAKDSLKNLGKRLEVIKKGSESKEGLDLNQFDDQNFISTIKSKIHEMASLSFADKVKLFEVTGKEKLSEDDKKLILCILSKIGPRDLNSLFRNAVKGNEIIKLMEFFANIHLGKYKAEKHLRQLGESEELQLPSSSPQSLDKTESEIEENGERLLEAFLKDIQDGMKEKVFQEKYDISAPTVNRRVKEILGVKNYPQARKFLKGKKIEEVLKGLDPGVVTKFTPKIRNTNVNKIAKYAINCEDCVVAGKNSKKNIAFDTSQEDFDKIMANRGTTKQSQVDLFWKCLNCGLRFKATFNNIEHTGTGCPDCNKGKVPITHEDCIKIVKNSTKNIEFAMTQKQFDDAMKNRGTTWSSQVNLNWKCKNCGLNFPVSFNNINNHDTGCPDCAKPLRGKDLGIFLLNRGFVLSPVVTENLRLFQRRIIQASKRKGKFPVSIKNFEANHPNNFSRGSRFDKRITRGTGRLFDKLKLREIDELIKRGRIVPLDSVSKVPPELAPIQKLIRAIDNYKGVKFLVPSKKWISHTGVNKISNRQEFKDVFLGSELPIFFKKGKKLLTGHIDVSFLVRGDTPILYVMDYKPVAFKNPKGLEKRIKRAFFDSIPQLVAYIKILRSAYGLKDFKIKGVTFNNKAAWVYNENILEEDVERFMRMIGNSENIVWKDYI